MKLKKGAICLLLFFLLLFSESRCVFAGESNQVSKVRNGVVRIFVVMQNETGTFYGLGTGFGVGIVGEDADTFVTNWHVVTSNGAFDYHDARVYILLDDETTATYSWMSLPEGEDPLDYGDEVVEQDGTYYVKVLTDLSLGSAVECEVLYAENQYPDVAVLRTKEPVANVAALPLRRVSQEMVGEKVYSIGYPGTADISSTEESGSKETNKWKASVQAVSVADGTISRCIPMELFGNTECIDHSAHINHGNSGGPLVLEDGSVIGINTYGYGEDAREYSVSIYADYAMDIMDDLGISYDVAGEGDDVSMLPFVVAGVLVLALLAAAVVIVVVRRRKEQRQPVPAAGNAYVPIPNSNPAVPNVRPVSSGTQDLRLQGLKGKFAGKRFALVQDVCIGRDARRCALVYPQEATYVSRTHCMIRMGSGGLTITDLGSTAGTFVNGRKLLPNQPMPLSVGDHVFLAGGREEFQITKKGGVV